MKSEFHDELVESEMTERSLKVAMWSVMLCVVIFILWALFTKVDEIAKAQGAVIPEGERQVLQSDLGGKLKKVLVREGQLVEKGQALVEFDATYQQNSLDELQSQKVTLETSIERMNAFLEQRKPDFSAYENQFPDIVAQQKAQLSAQQGLLYQKQIALVKENEQLSEQLNSVERSLPSYQNQLKATQEELVIVNKGFDAGTISQIRVLEVRQKLAGIEEQLEEARGRKALLERQADAGKQKAEQLLAEMNATVSQERAEAVSELNSLQARIRSGEAKLNETVLTSPLPGLVQSIPSTKEGAVIPPGGTVVELVPVGGKAYFKAQLSPKDVGFVKVAQSARVKIDAFDYSRFGALEGKVDSISPTTSQDDKGNVYYEVLIYIPEPSFRNQPGRFSILPGMTGEVDITTGEKSVFQYLWKPIYTNLSVAFGER